MQDVDGGEDEQSGSEQTSPIRTPPKGKRLLMPTMKSPIARITVTRM